jgi:phenylalanyl-tRNA synthetase beta chain
MRDVLELIQALAGGELVGVTDVYPAPAAPVPVSVSLDKINAVLGSSLSTEEVTDVFDRLGFLYTTDGTGTNATFTVTPSFERRDIVIPQDLAEEVGRIIGYDAIPSKPLPQLHTPVDQNHYRHIEALKDFLVERGYTELSTQTFAVEGDIVLANPLDQTRPALRKSLTENMQDSLARAKTTAPRVLGPAVELKLFEIGTVFTKEEERLALVFGYMPLVGKKRAAHRSFWWYSRRCHSKV